MKRNVMMLVFACLALASSVFYGCGDGDNGSPTPVQFSITTASLPAATVGVAYSQTLAATGGTTPYTWSISAGTLPAGLTLNAATGVISGTPTTTGTSTFTISVTDSSATALTATRQLSIVVNAMNITTTSLPAATVGIAYNQTLAVSGGTAPYNWSATVGTLPNGLTLAAATGVISGTPTTVGTSAFTVTVTDSATPTHTATMALSISVVAAGSPLTITTTSPLTNATFGVAYSQTLAATGGTTPYTWSISAGTLPSGLTMNASGVISGQPLVSGGPFNFTVMVTDSATPANTATQALSLTVTISASVLSGKTIFDASCQGCHSLGVYNSGGISLSGTTLAAIQTRFGSGASHNGTTMTATQINDMFAFVSLF